jgi:hypothetical protein
MNGTVLPVKQTTLDSIFLNLCHLPLCTYYVPLIPCTFINIYICNYLLMLTTPMLTMHYFRTFQHNMYLILQSPSFFSGCGWAPPGRADGRLNEDSSAQPHPAVLSSK